MKRRRLSKTWQNNLSAGDSQNLPSDKQGQQFGHYILQKKLGRGGMGTVFKAYHPQLDSYFALKMILPHKLGPEGIRRFAREARLACKLKHPNIVAVHDVGVLHNRHYIVMDYIQGRELRDLMREKRFWPRQAFEIILQIARALEYSHLQGIIHRDIKPSNIMITKQDEQEKAYLMDFGLASAVKEEGLTRTGQILGTPQYMSPEQARGEKRLDGRSDIYSLGAVLYEMLSGCAVVNKDHVMSILYDVVHSDVPLLSRYVHIARDAEAIVMKCLEKDPSRRYQKAGELSADIERYLRGEPVTAHAAGPLYVLWRKVQRQWKLSLAILLVMTTTLTFYLWNLNQQAKILQQQKDSVIRPLWEQLQTIMEHAKEKENMPTLIRAQQYCESILKIDAQHIAKDKRKTIQQEIAELKNKLKRLKKDAQKSLNLFQVKEAQNCYQQMMMLDPQGDDVKELGPVIQEAFHMQKLYAQTIALFKEPDLSPEHLKKCLQNFDVVIKKFTGFAAAHFQAGRACERLYKFTEAKNYYQQTIVYMPSSIVPRYYWWRLELDPHKLQCGKMEKLFKEVWQQDPQQAAPPHNLYYQLARAQYFGYCMLLPGISTEARLQLFKTSMDICNQVIANLPLSERVRSFAPGGSDNLTEIDDTNSLCYQAYFTRAQLNSYFIYRTCGNIGPHIVETQAIEDIIEQDYGQALRDCNLCTFCKPNVMEPYYLRGIIYSRMGDYRSGRDEIIKALSLKRFPRITMAAGICQASLGDLVLATRTLERSKQDYYKVLQDHQRASAQEHQRESKLSQAELDLIAKELDLINILLAFIYTSIDKPQKARQCMQATKNCNYHSWIVKAYITGDYKLTPKELQDLRLLITTIQAFPGMTPSNIGLLFKYSGNLFCAPPDMKRFARFVIPLDNVLFKHQLPLSGLRIIVDANRTTKSYWGFIMQHCLNKMAQRPAEYQKRNQWFSRELRNIAAGFEMNAFFGFFRYCSMRKHIRKILRCKKLPSALLCYHRAIYYYLHGKFEKACRDLQDALKYEPYMMSAHYALSTVYALMIKQLPARQQSRYAERAKYHLKQALYCGWSHFKDYTLKDEEFQALWPLAKIPLKSFQEWEQQGQKNAAQAIIVKKDLQYLKEEQEYQRALRILYFNRPAFLAPSSFHRHFDHLLVEAESYVMRNYYLTYQKCLTQLSSTNVNPAAAYKQERKIEQELTREIRNLLGVRGEQRWHWYLWEQRQIQEVRQAQAQAQTKERPHTATTTKK